MYSQTHLARRAILTLVLLVSLFSDIGGPALAAPRSFATNDNFLPPPQNI